MSTELPPRPAPPLTIAAAAFSHAGRERSENEDAYGLELDARLFIVADGMGGRAGGAVAAQMAVGEIARFFRQQHASPRTPWPFTLDRTLSLGSNLLMNAMRVANQSIRTAGAASSETQRMAATVAALAVGETQAVLAHIGDVRIYRLRARALARLTRDHSVIEEVRAARPEMPESDLARIAGRNVVTRALGTRSDVEPSVSTQDLARGDLFLICSDGLWSVVSDATLAQVLLAQPDLETAARRLADEANAAGGPDNITALLVRVA